MLTPLGCGVEPTWKRLLAGESGARKIEHFDVSDIPCKIAMQISRGDGNNGGFNQISGWNEGRRKVDHFIVFSSRRATGAGGGAAPLRRGPDSRRRDDRLRHSGIGGIADATLLLQERRASYRRSSFPVD
jgi:3-oxoacyl-[acyl-carrier-protein] synthase II